MRERTNPRAELPRCLRCGRSAGDTALNFKRELFASRVDAPEDEEPAEGFVCLDEAGCRRLARARGLPDLNFCRGCTLQISERLKSGVRPVRCGFCSRRFRGEHFSNCCDRCKQDQPSRAHLHRIGEDWVCRDIPACHRRMMRPKLRVLPGGARY